MQESTQNSGWFHSQAGANVFHWIHKPSSSARLGVVIAGPIGPEYMHCHRSIKYLATQLQQRDIATIRFDYPGYGNSSGSLFDAQLLQQWSDSIDKAADVLKTDCGVQELCIIALRSGSLLTARCLSINNSIDHLVYWYPYTQGAAFNRDMGMIDELLETQSNQHENYLNAGGYPLTNETAQDLKTIKLSNIEYQSIKNVLIINSSEKSGNRPLTKRLQESRINFEEKFFASLPKMARQAELSQLPRADVEAICDWLVKIAPEVAEFPGENYTPPEPLINQNFIESVFHTADAPDIFGIHCSAIKSDENITTPLVLITNGGAGHHVGPNRLHSELARKLASLGMDSLRFDLSNLGDSPSTIEQENNHPCPPHAVQDIKNVITSAKNKLGKNSFIIIGLCSGAHNAFHAQLELIDENIVETLLINPLTFYLKPGESILEPDAAKTIMEQSYYKDQAKDWRVWLRLMSNPGKIFNVCRFIFRFSFEKLKFTSRKLGSKLGITKPNRLHVDIEIILSRNKKISFYISENDPGYDMIMQEAGVAIKKAIRSRKIQVNLLPGVDHTFSALESRNGLIDSICEYLDPDSV